MSYLINHNNSRFSNSFEISGSKSESNRLLILQSIYKNLKIDNFSVLPGSELKLLKGLELGCSGIITATCNVTASLSRKVYDDFIDKKQQNVNEMLCKVRSTFDQFNLISGLHSFMSDKDEIYKNVLPPVSLLSIKDKRQLIEDLNKLNFKLESLKAA